MTPISQGGLVISLSLSDSRPASRLTPIRGVLSVQALRVDPLPPQGSVKSRPFPVPQNLQAKKGLVRNPEDHRARTHEDSGPNVSRGFLDVISIYRQVVFF